MPWLAKLDARAHTWPPAGRWLYLGVKWYLVFIGALALSRVLLDRVGIWPYFP